MEKPEEQTDVIDQIVTGTDESQPITGESDTAQVASEQGETTPPATEENRIPLSRLQEEIEKKRQAEAKAQLLQDQLALMQANQQQANQQQQASQPVSTYEQAMNDLGYDAEYLTESERIRVFARKDQLDNQVRQQQFMQQTNYNFIQTHPDYGEAVGRVNSNTGQINLSAEITEILQRKPYLTAAAYSSAEGAYNIVMQERKIKELETKAGTLSAQDTARNVDARTAPMSGAAAGGGAVLPSNMTLKTVDDVAAMEARVAAGEFD